MSESCANCRFYRDDYCCRYAPRPWNYLKYYELELIRDIAWSLRYLSKTETPSHLDELATEATAAVQETRWPDVREDEWCGEWEPAHDRTDPKDI